MPRGMTPRQRRTTMGALARKKSSIELKDLAKMSPEERAKWTKEADKAAQTDYNLREARKNERLAVAKGKVKTSARKLKTATKSNLPKDFGTRHSKNVEDRRIKGVDKAITQTLLSVLPKRKNPPFEGITPSKMNDAIRRKNR